MFTHAKLERQRHVMLSLAFDHRFAKGNPLQITMMRGVGGNANLTHRSRRFQQTQKRKAKRNDTTCHVDIFLKVGQLSVLLRSIILNTYYLQYFAVKC